MRDFIVYITTLYYRHNTDVSQSFSFTLGGGSIHLSDCHTGKTLSSLQEHAGNIMTVFAGDQAHLLCSGSADKTVRLWDLRVPKCIDVIASSSCVTSACFNYATRHSLLLATGACKVQRSFVPWL